MIAARTLRCARTYEPDVLDCSTTTRNGTALLARRHVVHAARVLYQRVMLGLTPAEADLPSRDAGRTPGTRSWS